MRGLVRAELDRVDDLEVGSGMLEAFAFGRGDLHSGMIGGALEYGHRISPNASLFGRGEVGYRYGAQRGLGYEALAGLRVRFK